MERDRTRQTVSLWAMLCAAALPVDAQNLVNGDCENNTAGTCQYNLPNPSFNGFMPNVTAYGGGNEVDIQQNGCNYGSPTPSGQYFISVANSLFGSPGDEVAFDVAPPFVAGNTYTISWLEQANTQFRPLDTLEIGVSDVLGSFGVRISATQPPDGVWIARSTTFTAPFNAQYITVRNLAPFEAWNFIDFPACAVNFNLGNDTTICIGNSLLLDATSTGATYLWSDNSTNATLSVSQSGTYWAQVSNGSCSFTDTIVVTVASTLSAALGNDTTLCTGQSLLLDATIAGGTYTWSDGSTNPTLNVTTTGSYWVDVQAGGCTYADTIYVNFLAPPIADIGPDTTLCTGSILALDATQAGCTYAWQNGSILPTFNVNAAGTYWVVITAGSCSDIDSITVAYQASLVVDLGNDSTLCIGSAITLDATMAGATYLWNDGSTNSTLMVDSSGTYSVDVSQSVCTGSDAITISFIAPPAPDLGADTAICPYDSLLLSANAPGSSLLWSDGSNGATLIAYPSAMVWVEADNGACARRDSMLLSVLPLPLVDIGPDTAVCEGAVVVLDATQANAAAYSWQDGSMAPFFVADQAGTYSVEVTAVGCSASDTMYLTVGQPALVDIGNDTLICPGYQVLLFADAPGATFLWSTGETSAGIAATRPDTFTVVVTLGPCTSSDTVVLRFNEIDCDCPLYAPNAMTSDGDGINDDFSPYMPCPAEEWELLIFDRWGEVIFRTGDQYERWAGGSLGKVVPDGVYIWQLNYRPLHSSEGRLRRGHVTVLH
ncbi:MAG: gliding motility-associated C-terminal domain-containing protein [Flavobacteriales bacterium]